MCLLWCIVTIWHDWHMLRVRELCFVFAIIVHLISWSTSNLSGLIDYLYQMKDKCDASAVWWWWWCRFEGWWCLYAGNQRLPDPVLVTHSAMLPHCTHCFHTATHCMMALHYSINKHTPQRLITLHCTTVCTNWSSHCAAFTQCTIAQCCWFHWGAFHCPHCLLVTRSSALNRFSSNDFTRQTTLHCTYILKHTLWLQCIAIHWHLYCLAVKQSCRVFRWIRRRSCWTCAASFWKTLCSGDR